MDAVECFSHGRYMQDAVEAEVAKRTLRGYDANEMPLSLSSGFTSSGMSMEAAGMMQILRVLVTQKYGTILPSLHLQQLNPYIEEPNDQESALFATETFATGRSLFIPWHHGPILGGYHVSCDHLGQPTGGE